MFMKTSEFEERFTAWLDGKLSPDEASAFEQELRTRGFDPAAARSAASVTTALLREHSPTPRLGHAQFFNHLIQRQIEADQKLATAAAGTRSWWGIPWFAYAAAACLLIAAVLFKGMIPVGGGTMADQSPYFATVVDARSLENNVSASTVYNSRDNVTVLWIDGLDYLPADSVVQ